jgi:thioredoxin reductase (NADPH)
MYKNKKVAVIGGGNTAVMEAIFLANFANEVYVIHRRDTLRADKIMQTKLFSMENIKCIWNSEVIEIIGQNKVEEIRCKNNVTNTSRQQKIDGVFIAVGTVPSSDCVKNLVSLDEDGYIKTDNTQTTCPGIFAAGDVVSGALKQAIYAAGQGALASKYVEEYIYAQ